MAAVLWGDACRDEMCGVLPPLSCAGGQSCVASGPKVAPGAMLDVWVVAWMGEYQRRCDTGAHRPCLHVEFLCLEVPAVTKQCWWPAQ